MASADVSLAIRLSSKIRTSGLGCDERARRGDEEVRGGSRSVEELRGRHVVECPLF